MVTRFFSKRGIGTRAVIQLGLADVPGPRSFPFVGAMPYYLPIIGEYNPQRLHKTGLLKYNKFGPLIKEKIFSDTILYLYDPRDIEKILRTRNGSWPKRMTHAVLEHLRENEMKEHHHNGGILMTNGEEWAKWRTTFQKSLAREEVSRFIPSVDEMTTELVSKFGESFMRKHLETDFLDVIFSFCSDFTGLNLFGEKWNSINNYSENNSLAKRIIMASTVVNHNTGATDHGMKTWKRFTTPSYAKIKECAQILDDESTKQLNARMVGDQLVPKDQESLLDNWIRGGNTDYKQLLTFISDFLLAAVDTVAYTVSFVLYHLSVNLEAQEKLFKELYQLAPCKTTPITLEMLGQISYLKKSVKESMRLNPLTIGIGRVLTEDMVLGGYYIPQETQIVTMSQVTSRLAEYVEYPDAFVPERYDLDSKLKRMHPFTSLPFGFGSRSCIGRRLAEQNMNIFLFRIFRLYHVKWNGPRELDCITSLINKPDAPLLFTFTPRTH